MPPSAKQTTVSRSASKSNSIRIIGGQWRGRKLDVLDADGLRPTLDRIRETLFNWLMHDIYGANCLDLFAGSGALGLEALSREAKFTQFVERESRNAAQISKHFKTLNCENAQVYAGDAAHWMQQHANQQFDVVFIDPPFSANVWQETFEQLDSSQLLANNAKIYVEAPKDAKFTIPDAWHVHRDKTFGTIRAMLCLKDTIS